MFNVGRGLCGRVCVYRLKLPSLLRPVCSKHAVEHPLMVDPEAYTHLHTHSHLHTHEP